MGRCDDIHGALHGAIGECVAALRLTPAATLLDVGCWDGRRTADYARMAGIPLGNAAGIEYFKEQAAVARRLLRCEVLDIEQHAFPFADGSFDLVVCNQVFEHCKNIFKPLSEIRRVLRPGGSLIFSVPNLASLHNRVLLMSGRQPSSIRVFGPHVRGFTHRSVLAMLRLNGLFRVERVHGVGFYPFPIRVGNAIARRVPGAAHTTVVHAIRTGTSGLDWEAVMRERSEQTAWE
jgi:SAM-dependent methyltransferase